MRLHKWAKNMSGYITAYICKTENVITHLHVAPISNTVAVLLWLIMLMLTAIVTLRHPT